MPGPIQFTIDASMEGFIRSALRAADSVKGVENGLQKLASTFGKTAGEIKRGMDDAGNSAKEGFGAGAVRRVAEYAAALGTVEGALGAMRKVYGLVSDELAVVIARQKRAAEGAVEVANAHKGILRNMAGATDAEVKGTYGDVKRVAEKTGVASDVISKAVQDAISATGGQPGQALVAVERAAQMFPDAPSQIAQYAGTLVNFGKVTGSDDPRVNQGLFASIAARSQLTDPAKQAEYIAPAMINMRQFGATPTEGGAFYAAMTNAIGDRSGRISRTAAIGLAAQLESFFTGKTDGAEVSLGEDGSVSLVDMKGRLEKAMEADPDLRGRYEAALKTGSKMTMGQRLAALQRDPALGRLFMGGASFQKQVSGAMRALVTEPGGQFGQTFARFMREIPSDFGALGTVADEQLRQRWLDPEEGLAATGRMYAATERETYEDDLAGAAKALHREGVQKTLNAAGFGAMDQKIAGWMFRLNSWAGGDSRREALTQLRGARESLLHPREQSWASLAVSAFTGGEGAWTNERAPNADERRGAEALQKMIARLEAIQAATERMAGGGAVGMRDVRRDDHEARK